MALFRLLDEKDEFGEMYANLLARRLLLAGGSDISSRVKGSTEAEFLARLTETCGSAFTAHFDRMCSDIQGTATNTQSQGTETGCSITLLTGGTWTVKGKRLLPGHPIFPANPTWPQEAPIKSFEAAYLANPAHRSRRLHWIPALSEVHFDLVVPDGGGNAPEKRISIRASCAQLSLLQQQQQICADPSQPVNPADELHFALVAPMIKCGLVDRTTHRLTNDLSSLPESIDLFSPLISDLLSTQHHISSTAPSQIRSLSTTGTPSRKSTVSLVGTSSSIPSGGANSHNNNHHPLSSADKMALLQSQIMRLLKQLRSLSLSELYNRLSMLPVLLSRFSPEVEEVDGAVLVLAEKEFVQIVQVGEGGGGDEAVLSGDNNVLKEAMAARGSDYVQVRYLA